MTKTELKSYDVMTRDVPAWYELGLDGTTFVIRARSSVFGQLCELCNADSEPIIGLARRLDLPPFTPLTEKSCGFGRALVRMPDKNGWIIWRLLLEPISGPKIKDGVRWDLLYPKSATLATLLWALSAVPIPLDSGPPQLLVVSGICCGRGFHENSFTVLMSRFAVRAIFALGEGAWRKAVCRAMRRIHSFIFPNRAWNDASQYDARLLNGKRLYLRCPGDACDLGVAPEELPLGGAGSRGHRLMPHNVDSPLQQLTLLVGLAALHDCLRGRKSQLHS
jgi:hypothetical protein